jgi:hypothetical protein
MYTNSIEKHITVNASFEYPWGIYQVRHQAFVFTVNKKD